MKHRKVVYFLLPHPSWFLGGEVGMNATGQLPFDLPGASAGAARSTLYKKHRKTIY